MLGSFELRRISLPREPPQAASSDSDGSSSSSSDDERNHRDEHLLHPLDGLPNADAVETVPRILRDSQEPDGLCRLPDVARNRWILHAGTETITNACDLTAQSTGMIWLKKSKITAKILCSIWTELDELNWQEQQKKEWFVEVAGQSVEKILEVARSFSDARWSDGHILDLLTTFDALVDVLYKIQPLPSKISEPEVIRNEVAGIIHKMVIVIIEKLGETTNDRHPTIGIIVALEIFHSNRDILQSILPTGANDYTTELSMINRWVAMLKEYAERKLQDGKDRQYIFLLNNIYCVSQMRSTERGFLSIAELESRLCSLIKQYTKSYLEECWVPLLSSLESPCRSSLDKFTEDYSRIYYRQMKWKVQTELKKMLRKEIDKLIVLKYKKFLDELPKKSTWLSFSKKQPKKWEVLATEIAGIFEHE